MAATWVLLLGSWKSIACGNGFCTRGMPGGCNSRTDSPPGDRSWTLGVNSDLRSENVRSLDPADRGDGSDDIVEGAVPGELGGAKRMDLEGLPALALGPPVETLVLSDKFGIVET